MVFEVLKYDVFGNGTVGVGEIATAPKSATPTAFLKLREFTFHLLGRASFHQPHQIAHRQLGRLRHKHVDVIRGQQATDNVARLLTANLAANGPHPELDIALQYLVGIF